MQVERKFYHVMVVMVVMVLFTIQPSEGYAQIPQKINYQGYLADSGGTPIDDTLSIIFSIYDANIGGNLLWTETRTVTVSEGVFSVNLGDLNPIALAFDTEYYLGIEVDGDGEMIPRQPLTSVGYAFRAEEANILPDGAVKTIMIYDQAVTTEKVAEQAITDTKIASGAVTSAAIANQAVGSTQIADGSVSSADLENNAVTVDKIGVDVISSIDNVYNDGGNIDLLPGSNVTITPNDATNTITIAASGITDHGQLTGLSDDDHPQYLNNSRGNSRYVNEDQADSISSAMIQNSAVGTTEIANGSVVNADLANDAVTSAKIQDGSVATADLANNAVTVAKISPNVVSSIDGVSNDGGNIDLLPGSNVTITPNDATNTITIAASGITDHGQLTGLSDDDHPQYLNNSRGDSRYVNEGQENSVTSGMVAFNYAGSNSEGGPATNLACSSCVSSSELNFTPGDITAVVAGTGLTDGGNSGSVTLNVGEGTGINVTSDAVSVDVPLSLHAGTGPSSFTIEGRNGGYGPGVKGYSLNGPGIYGEGGYGIAGYFKGNVDITGSLTKGSGTFKIDHPLDPENKYLSHSFVESPEMKNIYDGVIELDKNGEAWVQLPEWFEALNKDFRYQLTCIGGFAQVYIAEEISDNSFKISGGIPGLRVSWQITGVRQDAYALANPILVEEEKPPEERGYYLHPEVYDQSESQGISWARDPEPIQEKQDVELLSTSSN